MRFHTFTLTDGEPLIVNMEHLVYLTVRGDGSRVVGLSDGSEFQILEPLEVAYDVFREPQNG